MTKTIDQEILDALAGADSWLASYQLSRRIERRRKADGRRSRFLFWWIDSLVPFGTVHRALDGLVREGRVVRRAAPPRRGRWLPLQTGHGAVIVSAALVLRGRVASVGSRVHTLAASTNCER
jgi:hypothetical protein